MPWLNHGAGLFVAPRERTCRHCGKQFISFSRVLCVCDREECRRAEKLRKRQKETELQRKRRASL